MARPKALKIVKKGGKLCKNGNEAIQEWDGQAAIMPWLRVALI